MHVPPCPANTLHDSKKNRVVLIVLVSLAVLIVLIAFVSVLCIFKRHRKEVPYEPNFLGSLVDIEPVSRRDTDNVDEVQENGQNGDPVPVYQDDTADADGHVDDVVHQEQEVPSQVPVDLPRRSDRERRPSTRYSPSQYVLLTDGGEPESYEEAMENTLPSSLGYWLSNVKEL
nr:Retrovirus-related Pol polyprotein from transposon TNT 1-94 [Ipomoea batatas]